MKYILFSFLLATALPVTSSFAQVTIGSAEPPVRGALLDLKTEADGSSTKGLGLPRVKLIKTADSDISLTIEGVAANAYTGDHTGLLVYNVVDPSQAACAPIPAGVHVWDGGKWYPLTSGNSTSIFVDPRDGEEYRYANFGAAGDWMLENMRATTYAQGGVTPILMAKRESGEQGEPNTQYKRYAYPTITNGATDGTDDSYFKQQRAMGLFYTKAAALNMPNLTDPPIAGEIPATDPVQAIGHQGICPTGWHVPSDVEWNILEKVIYDNPKEYSTYNDSELPFSPPIWDPAWDAIAYTPPRGSSTGEGHGKAMLSQCEPLSSASPYVGKSKNISQGGLNIMLVGWIHSFTTAAMTDYGTTAVFWAGGGYRDEGRFFGGFTNYELVTRGDLGKPFMMYSVRCKKNN